MSIPPYVKGYPQDGSSLGSTKAQIRANLDGTFETLGINHFDQNSANPGKHQYIQMPTTDRPNTTGTTEILLYNGVEGGVNNLYFVAPNKTVANAYVQMTTNLIPARTQKGYSWLPGGLLIQWGSQNVAASTTVDVTFAVDFATVGGFLPVITTGPVGNSAIGTVTTHQFTFQSPPTSGVFLQWHAIGPI